MATDALIQKWQPVLEHADLEPITDAHKRTVTAQLLENQYQSAREQAIHQGGSHTTTLLGEASPTNAMGASSSVAADGSIDTFDPVLISLVRRSMPNLIAYDICGVQPMTGPTGLIFAMKSRYASQSGTEALFNEADTDFSARNAAGSALTGSGDAQSGTNPAVLNDSSAGTYTRGQGHTTAEGEALGDAAGNAFAEMAFSIEKATVTAKSRALKAEYTMELA